MHQNEAVQPCFETVNSGRFSNLCTAHRTRLLDMDRGIKHRTYPTQVPIRGHLAAWFSSVWENMRLPHRIDLPWPIRSALDVDGQKGEEGAHR